MSSDYFTGFDVLDKELNDWIKHADNVLDILEVGAEEFVKDANRLAQPYSKVMAAGYMHVIKSITYQRGKEDISVGWGKYYGPMLENGTFRMNKRAHLKPLWNRNQNKYNQSMLKAIGR